MAPNGQAAAPVAGPAPEPLLRQLRELERRVQAQLAEEHSFRKLNAKFPPNDATTALLLAACEKMAAEKEAMARAHFEEHTSELSYLCKRYNTSIEVGHSDRSHQDHVLALLPGSTARTSREKRKSRTPWFVCCQRDFPPQQAWWLDPCAKLQASFQVLRGGVLTSVPARDLVPGDIVFLAAGQRCAADARVLVHEAGCTVECSHLTVDSVDVRRVSTEATSPATIDSANIILRDSYLLTGSLFCMVVRPPQHSLIPNGRAEEEDGALRVDATAPQGMSVSQCRSLFKQLVAKAKLVCFSFQVMLRLARTRVIVVLLSQEMDRGTAAALCGSAKRLGKSVLFVAEGCKAESSEALVQALGAEYVDFNSGAADTDGVSTAIHSLSVSQAHTGSGGLNSPVSAGVSHMGSLQSRPETIITSELRSRLQALARQMCTKSTHVVMHEPGTDLITMMCQILHDEGGLVSLAAGGVQHAGAIRNLLMGARYRALPGRSQTASMESRGCLQSPVHYPSVANGVTPRPSISASLSRQASQMSTGRLSQTSSPARTLDPVHNSPAFNLRCGGDSSKYCIDVAIAVNTVSVISDYSDCAMLSSDLGCLGQALELSARMVPSAAVAAATVHRPAVGSQV